MRPYEIWIGSYYHMSGGVRALHVLRDELLDRGIPAWMMYEGKDHQDKIGDMLTRHKHDAAVLSYRLLQC